MKYILQYLSIIVQLRKREFFARFCVRLRALFHKFLAQKYRITEAGRRAQETWIVAFKSLSFFTISLLRRSGSVSFVFVWRHSVAPFFSCETTALDQVMCTTIGVRVFQSFLWARHHRRCLNSLRIRSLLTSDNWCGSCEFALFARLTQRGTKYVHLGVAVWLSAFLQFVANLP